MDGTLTSALPSNHRILIVDSNEERHSALRKILQGARPDTSPYGSIVESRNDPPLVYELDSASSNQEAVAKLSVSREIGSPYAMAFLEAENVGGLNLAEKILLLRSSDPALQVAVCAEADDDSWTESIERLERSEAVLVLRNPLKRIEVLRVAHALSGRWLISRIATAKLRNVECLARQRSEDLVSHIKQLRGEIAEREKTQLALRKSEQRLSEAFSAFPFPVAILTERDMVCVSANRALLEMFGIAPEEAIGRTIWSIGVSADPASHGSLIDEVATTRKVRGKACKIRATGREDRLALLWIEPFEMDSGRHLLAVLKDVSEHAALESKLRQMQKLEAIGQLAAGIAHDFNNLLTVIQGHASLRLSAPSLDDSARKSFSQIQDAAQIATDLTRQLLAFSRKQVMQKRSICLKTVVGNLTGVLRRLVPETILLDFRSAHYVPLIHADQASLEQVILNLVVNARDAMPNGGRIVIDVSGVTLDERHAAAVSQARQGGFLRLRVADTGHGMSESTLKRIFEPFFTTKEVGKGTGMGLAMVDGIVGQHDGWIEVASEPRVGSRFDVYFPTAKSGDFILLRPSMNAPQPTGNGEVILIAEDEDSVRSLASEVLSSHGFQVIEASDGHEAIRAWREYPDRIDLLITDMVMPGGISGTDLAHRIRRERPSARVIFTSGYSTELVAPDMGLRQGENYLPKPYMARDLIVAVNRVLDLGADPRNLEPELARLSK